MYRKHRGDNVEHNEFIVPVGDVIREYLEAYGINQKELANRLGMSEKHVSNFLNAKSRLTEEVAIKLESIIPNVSASYWLNYEMKYREYLAREKMDLEFEKEDLDKLAERFHFKEAFKNTGWDKMKQAKEMLKLLRISSFDNFEATYSNLAVNFMEDGGQLEPTVVWLKLCEEEIEIQNAEIDEIIYDKKNLEKKLPMLHGLAQSDENIILTKNCRKLLNKLGIYLVYYEAIVNCKVRGALMTYKGHPVICISGRFKTHDHVWFALMHEIGHLLLHYNEKESFISYEEDSTADIRETEANHFARDFFIKDKEYEIFVEQGMKVADGFSEQMIRKFAIKQKVHPGIVLARLQHDKYIGMNQLNHLKTKVNVLENI